MSTTNNQSNGHRQLRSTRSSNGAPSLASEGNTKSSSDHFQNDKIDADSDKYNEMAEKYLANCAKFDITVDPSVSIALKTGWSILQPSRKFTEGSMLPLMGILEDCESVKKLNLSNITMLDSRFRQAGNGNSNARVLNFILQRNHWINELNLSNTGLDDDGVKEICQGIEKNTSIQKLNLSFNHFGEEGAKYLTDALQINQTVNVLDISRNALGFRSINNILCVCRPRNVEVATFGNYVFEEILNSVSHGVAFLGSVVGSVILISEAADSVDRTDYHFWACTLYSGSLMFLFLSSCLFHSFFMLPTTCSDLNNPLTTTIELIIFCCMGSGCILVYPILVTELCKEALMLTLLCGAVYLTGIIFFILGEYKPIYHTIWHMFVVVAATIHWFAIYFFIVNVSIDTPTKAVVTDIMDSVSAAGWATANIVSHATNQAANMTFNQ